MNCSRQEVGLGLEGMYGWQKTRLWIRLGSSLAFDAVVGGGCRINEHGDSSKERRCEDKCARCGTFRSSLGLRGGMMGLCL